MSDQTSILDFDRVTTESDPAEQCPMREITFRLPPGEILVVRLDPMCRAAPFGDLVCGIRDPDSGLVSFLGEPWTRRRATDAAAARSRIGRIFESGGWLSYLNIDENMTLARRHHTHLPAGKILGEIRACAGRLGIDSLPAGRPAHIDPRLLLKLQAVRALYTRPRLLILERPLSGMDDDFRSRMQSLIDDLRTTEGTAVLCIANWKEPTFEGARLADLTAGCWTCDSAVPTDARETDV
jgi:phospholipid/cholesterol/gamma-HCH transport system ATP-binding protein